jgi:polysaccharide pyruvyl transferase WcaK-like protein
LRELSPDAADTSLVGKTRLIDQSADRQPSQARAVTPRADHLRGVRRIGLISPCGWGNLGDAAILDAAIFNIRERWPGAEFHAFTLNPTDTAAKHRITSGTLVGFSVPGYLVREPTADSPAPGPSSSSSPEPKAKSSSFFAALRRRLTSARLLKPVWAPLRRLRSAILFVEPELGHLLRSLRAARNLDLVLVAGGGQLDDYWGGPWGHPFVLYRWAILARLAGIRFIVLSVGTGTVRGRLSRWFISRSLRRAFYRSYRDQGSKDLVRFASITHSDPVVPDLAFSYPIEPEPSPSSHAPAGRRLVVGVSPMCYADPRCWPEKDATVYEHYVRKMAGLVGRLSSSGFEVVLFATEHVIDGRTIKDVQDRLWRDGYRTGYVIREVETVPFLIECIRETDVVIASRLHGVLLAHLAARPVLAISYERKVKALMADFENDAYCLDINTFDIDGTWDRFRWLLPRRQEVVERNIRKVGQLREQLRAQYDRILARDGVDSRP